jgi:hypothetical protein
MKTVIAFMQWSVTIPEGYKTAERFIKGKDYLMMRYTNEKRKRING